MSKPWSSAVGGRTSAKSKSQILIRRGQPRMTLEACINMPTQSRTQCLLFSRVLPRELMDREVTKSGPKSSNAEDKDFCIVRSSNSLKGPTDSYRSAASLCLLKLRVV